MSNLQTDKLHMIIANPAGNITAFVLDPVEQCDYKEVAGRIFAMQEYGVEQVGFVKDDNRMEMSGLEFCGNATRSFALLSAMRQGIEGEATLYVSVSGATNPLRVEVDTETRNARISVELPLETVDFAEFRKRENLESEEYDWIGDGTLVIYEGITHAVALPSHEIVRTAETTQGELSHPDHEGTSELETATYCGLPLHEYYEEWFSRMRELICDKLDPPAMGVVFCEEGTRMTPVVYVKNVDSVYFEGSCGSGTTAYAAAHSLGKQDGIYRYEVEQPAGTILATCTIEEGRITELTIESPVEFSEIIEVPR